MDNDTRPIPLHMVKMILRFFKQSLSEKELDELDEWITASDDNQQVFEELLVIIMPMIPDDYSS